MRRRTAPLASLRLAAAAALAAAATLAATAAPAGAADGPCTAAAKASMPEGTAHRHDDIAQHGFACRMRQVAFLSLKEELKERPDAVLGEMDVKKDLAAIAVAFPESGFLLFDVADPSQPKLLSWYRGSQCEQTIIDVDCGAFIDISSDGKTVFLAVQSLSVVPGGRPDPNVRPVSQPGVEVVDVSDPRKPALAQTYPVISQGGVHTARSHAIGEGPAGGGPREPGEYVFAIANGVGIDISRLERDASGKPSLTQVATLPLYDEHDTLIQNDPITGRTYLYVAAGLGSGFFVYDVTDPADPEPVAEWDLTPQCGEDWYGHTVDVTQRGNRRYVTIDAEIFNLGEMNQDDQAKGCGKVAGNGDRPGPLWIVDASDLSKLARIEERKFDGKDDALRQRSEAALIATWTNPAERAGGNLIFSPHNQQIAGDRIYLSHYHGGVYVLDASAAFAGRKERPVELGFIVPSGPETRPIFKPALPPLMPFFTDALSWRPSIWDQFFYKGYVLAGDMVGGFYSFQYEGDRAKPRVSSSLTYLAGRTASGRRCARDRIRLRIGGQDRGAIEQVDFFAGKRRLARDRRPPFAASIARRQLRPGRVNRLRAEVVLGDGRTAKLEREVLVCPAPGRRAPRRGAQGLG